MLFASRLPSNRVERERGYTTVESGGFVEFKKDGSIMALRPNSVKLAKMVAGLSGMMNKIDEKRSGVLLAGMLRI